MAQMRKAPASYQIVDISWNKPRVCIDDNIKKYSIKKLCIDKRMSIAMVNGSKYKTNSWNLFDSVISVDFV